MGARGPLPKPASERIRRNSPVSAHAPEELQVAKIPRARSTWPKTVQGEWRAFWKQDVGRLITDSSLPALFRLFDLKSERAEIAGLIGGAFLVQGERGGQSVHPLIRPLRQIDNEIRQCEDRFGLTPVARLRLGVQVVQARSAVADELRRAEPEVQVDRRDPRVMDV